MSNELINYSHMIHWYKTDLKPRIHDIILLSDDFKKFWVGKYMGDDNVMSLINTNEGTQWGFSSFDYWSPLTFPTISKNDQEVVQILRKDVFSLKKKLQELEDRIKNAL